MDFTDRLDLSGRVAFVTGTSRGIGKALALSLAEAGADVVSTGKTVEDDGDPPGSIHQTAEEVRERGRDAIAVQLDVRDAESVEAAVDRTVDELGGIDVLVNNAGAIHLAPVAETSPERFDLLMDVNARGAFVTTRAALPHLVDGEWGHIVTNAPPMATDPLPGMAPYLYSKLGMTYLTRAVAAEVEGENVAANAVWPVTAIETRATRYHGMGTPEQWRTPQVYCDAVLELLSRDPAECSGNAFYDEELLREAGVEDFSPYSVVDGANPPPLSAQMFDPSYERLE